MAAKAETTFGKELNKSIMMYLNSLALPLPVILKMHGSTIMSGVPDLLIITSKGNMFAELKTRKSPPKRKFDLLAGLSPGQRTMIQALVNQHFPVFLIVKINKSMALVYWFSKEIPDKVIIDPKEGSLLPRRCLRMDKKNGLWNEIDTLFNWCK